MTADGEEIEEEFALVMPFVVCASAGGPYDDAAFCAGFRLGQHDAELRASPSTAVWQASVEPASLPQYDLLAMHHGFLMEYGHTEHPNDWVFVSFVRPPVEQRTAE